MASFQVVQLEGSYDLVPRSLNAPSSPSSSSLSSTATAPNLPGAGRTVGRLLDNVGARLESNVKGHILRRRRAKTKTHLGATALVLAADSSSPASSIRTGKQRLELELKRQPSISSISSNATAHNLPGPGRTMGLLFDYLGRQLESMLNVSATRFGAHPSAVAAQIRRLCLHHRTTIQDRHSEDFSGLLTRKEKRKLSRLCAKLVGHASSPVHSTQRSALEEMLRLVIEDPLVCMAIQDCNLRKLDAHYNDSDVLLSTARALGSPELAHIHDVWSYALSFRWKSLQYKEEEKLRSLLDETFVTATPDTSYLIHRYLVSLFGEVLSLDDSDWDYSAGVGRACSDLMERYMSLLESEPEKVEWSTIDQGLVAYYSTGRFEMQRNMESDWSPDCDLIIEHAHQLPMWASQYFAAPELRRSEWTAESGRKLEILGLEDFVKQGFATGREEFVEELTGQRKISKQILALRAAVSGREYALKDTILAKDIFLTFSLLVDATETYLFDESRSSRKKALRQTKDGCSFLLSYLSSERNEFREIAEVLISTFCNLSRYCRMVMSEAVPVLATDISIDPSLIHSLVPPQDVVNIPINDYYHEFQKYYIFYRVAVGGEYSVYSGWVDLESGLRSMNPLDGRIDIMLVPPSCLVPIDTSRTEFPIVFYGHYPLLGGVDSTGRPLYMSNLQNIALIREDGESAVDRQSRALVLKHNPSDALPPYPKIPRGAMDQTGPLYWLEVWPTRDPELLEDLESRRGRYRDRYHNSEGDHDFDIVDIVLLEIQGIEDVMEELHGRGKDEVGGFELDDDNDLDEDGMLCCDEDSSGGK